MQLKIRREEHQIGLFKKKTNYTLKSQFVCSEEEEVIILEKLGLGEHIVAEYFWNGYDHAEEVRYFINKDRTTTVSSVTERAELETQIQEAAKNIADMVRQYLEAEESGSHAEQVIEL